MMMDHHRFNIQPSKTSNVMIGTGSRSGSSDTTDELTASDPATTDDFDYASNNNTNTNNTMENGILNGRTSPTMQSPSLFGDDAFDKITMDFDSIMANNDLDVSNRLKSSSSDNSVNSEMILDKLNAELGGTSDLKDSAEKGKLGDIGDELDMELLDALINPSDENNKGAPNDSSSIDQLFKENNSDSSIDKLLNLPLIDMDSHNLPPAANTDNSNNNNNKNNDSNTANINLSLKKSDSNGSLCDSMGSLPSIGKISPNASFANMNTGMQASVLQQMQQQQQQSMMMQRQQQLFLQQQMQQQQGNNSQNNNNNNNNNSSGNASSIQSIVNDQLSQLPQGNQLTKLGVAGLEQEKMKLIQRLQQIENSGMPMNVNQQQQQQQQQQQFLLQKQMFLQQQKQQLQQQQLQQQQQQGLATAQSMPSLRTGGQLLQGQMQIQGQQNSFAMNQQMMQQQQQQQGGIGQGIMSPPMSVNMNNNNNNNSNSMFANTSDGNNDNNNNNNFKNKNNNISSIMGMKGKDTPLLSFLRNKKRSGGGSSSNMMSMTGKQQQQLASDNSLVGASNHSNSTTSSGGILDAAPIDFSSSTTNPFLRKQMMNNLDKSVNRMNSARGRLGGMAGGRGLSSSIRRNMMQQMTSSGQLSKTSKDLQRKKSSDSYESAGIIARVSSADHIPSRRTSLTAGAAKAQNRRFTLSRSHNSFGNLTKTKSRGLTKSGGGGSSSTRSLGGGGSSTRSLGSNDSASSLIPVKRRGSMSGGRGGHGAKHKLGSGGGSARRISSVPYMGTSLAESAAMIQQRMMEENQQQGPRHNDGWP